MKQGRKAICFCQKSKGIPIFELGNENNLLWGAYQLWNANGGVNVDSESWGAAAITLAGTSGGGFSFGSNELFYIVPNEQGYIANNYVHEGSAAHTKGLGGTMILCVEAYRTGSGNPNFRYAKNVGINTTSYSVDCSQTVSSATPTIYRLEVEFKANYRIEFNAVSKCGNFIINNIWLEEID